MQPSDILNLLAPALALSKQQTDALQATYDLQLNGYQSDQAAIKAATDRADAAETELANANTQLGRLTDNVDTLTGQVSALTDALTQANDALASANLPSVLPNEAGNQVIDAG